MLRWQELRPGAAQKMWVQSQTTFVALAKDEESGWCARVLKQKIWVEGVSYELQEIYGMEHSAAASAGVSLPSPLRGTSAFSHASMFAFPLGMYIQRKWTTVLLPSNLS